MLEWIPIVRPRGALILCGEAEAREQSSIRQVADKDAGSARPLWLSLRDWQLAVGSGLVPSIPVFRSVRDYSQRA